MWQLNTNSIFGKFIFLLNFTVISITTNAQQDHYLSQYILYPGLVNPGFIGSNNRINVNAIHKQSFIGFPSNPNSIICFADIPYSNNRLGAGIKLSRFSFGNEDINSALFMHSIKVNLANGYLSLGIQVGIKTVTFQNSNYLVRDIDDPTINRNNFILPELGFGLAYYNNSFFAGISVQNILKTAVPNSFNSMPYQAYLLSGYKVKASETVSVIPNAYLYTHNFENVLFGLGLNIQIYELFWIGASVQNRYSICASAGLHVNALVGIKENLKLSYAYDTPSILIPGLRWSSHEITLLTQINIWERISKIKKEPSVIFPAVP